MSMLFSPFENLTCNSKPQLKGQTRPPLEAFGPQKTDVSQKQKSLDVLSHSPRTAMNRPSSFLGIGPPFHGGFFIGETFTKRKAPVWLCLSEGTPFVRFLGDFTRTPKGNRNPFCGGFPKKRHPHICIFAPRPFCEQTFHLRSPTAQQPARFSGA